MPKSSLKSPGNIPAPLLVGGTQLIHDPAKMAEEMNRKRNEENPQKFSQLIKQVNISYYIPGTLSKL